MTIEIDDFIGDYALSGISSSCFPAGTITFNTPDVVGPATFNLNGIIYTANVVDPFIEKPHVIFPTNNLIYPYRNIVISCSKLLAYIYSSKPEQNLGRITFQISQSPDFVINTEIVQENSLGLIELFDLVDDDYYIRFNYNYAGYTSLWSDTIKFTVQYAAPALLTEVGIISDPDTDLKEGFGTTAALSLDGNILVVGKPYANGEISLNLEVGAFFVYKKVGASWVLQQKIECPEDLPYLEFGAAVKLSDDKQTIVTTSKRNMGAVYVFQTTVPNDYTTLTLVDSINTSIPSAVIDYGFESLAINSNASIIALGDPWNDQEGKIHIFNFDGVNLLLTQIISTNSYSKGLGESLFLTADGNTLVCTDSRFNGSSYAYGPFYTYKRNSHTHIFEMLTLNDVSNMDYFFTQNGTLSRDGNLFIISEENLYTGIGNSVIIFEFHPEIDNTWVKKATMHFPEWETLGGTLTSSAISADGTIIILSSSIMYPTNLDFLNGTNEGTNGTVYILQKINNVWTRIAEINSILPSLYFGELVLLDSNATKLIISSDAFEVGNIASLHVFN